MKTNEMLLQYMKEHYDEFLDILKTSVEIECPTEGPKENLEKCREYFTSLFEELGFKCTLVPSNSHKCGDHTLMEYGTGKKQILFIGHYDTVYDIGTFADRTFWMDDKYAYGPGIYDMKGGIVQAYMACKALIDLDIFPSDKKIAFLMNSDEETGSHTSHDKYAELAKDSAAAIVFEPSVTENIGLLTGGRTGRGYYTLTAKGHQAHSGQEPEKAESGLIEIAKQAAYLETLTDLSDESSMVTVSCTSINGGYPGWCTIPGEASLTFDFRCATKEQQKEYDEKFRNLTPFNPNVKLTLSGGIDKPVYEINNPGNVELFNKAIEIGHDYGFEVTKMLGHGGTDGNFTSAAGCPTIDGFCLAGNYVHQPGKEFIILDAIVPKTAFTAGFILAI